MHLQAPSLFRRKDALGEGFQLAFRKATQEGMARPRVWTEV
jgi:hypothetical protein